MDLKLNGSVQVQQLQVQVLLGEISLKARQIRLPFIGLADRIGMTFVAIHTPPLGLI